MKKNILFVLFIQLCCFLSFISADAQVQTARYVAMSSKIKGYYEYLPQGYSTGTGTYPLIISISGFGEYRNTDPTDPNYRNDTALTKLLESGLPKLINQGGFPASFTVNSQTFKFLVIAPQFTKAPYPSAMDVDSVINYAVAHYRVDTKRIYVTGYSWGGGVTWEYASSKSANANRIAAIVPIAGGSSDPTWAKCRVIAAANLPVWATHNSGDGSVPVSITNAWIDTINMAPAPTPLAKKTIFNSTEHDAWTRTYDPASTDFGGVNIYQWMLQYQRGSVTPVNQAPKANAGPDELITFPVNSITLKGSGTDADGTIASYLWSKISGPASYTFSSTTVANPTVNNLVAGSYTFRLTVKDNSGASSYDDVVVTVNQPPQANAGEDKTITLPANSVTLSGSGTDADGSVNSYLWSKISGPANGTISTPNSATTQVNDLIEGTYFFSFAVTDNSGAVSKDTVKVIVNPAPVANKPPIANAGVDKDINLPENSVALSGSGSDADGTISLYSWSKISGPTQYTFNNSTIPNPIVSNLVAGIYTFRLTVKDNGGATGYDDVVITVNQPPKANAGTDQTITLPASSVTLSGSGTDADGTIASYTWSKISGPASSTIATPANAATTVTNLVQGTYWFTLLVTDNKGATDRDTMIVVVNPAPVGNQPPVANAGADNIITLPANSVDLNGSGTDADGTISSYTWSKVSGPASFTFSNSTVPNPTVSNLQAGSYTFRLTVKDNKGATGYDDVIIIVNQAPKANAGADELITLPVNSITLKGSGTDADGTIASYLWSKISGPASGSLTTPNNATTTASGLVQGTYSFAFIVTDNKGAIGRDTMNVIVKAATPANQAPKADAGSDKIITLPTNSVTLSGSGTDADGTIISFLWSKVSGPSNGTISSSGSAQTTVAGLVQGIYLFELTVKDNVGATGKDTVKITVNAAAVTVTKYIKVNVYGGTNPYTNTQWNNWNVGTTEARNIASGTLKYSDGTTSGISAVLSHSQSVGDNRDTYNGGMAPAEVLRYTSYSTLIRTLVINGLSTSKKFNMELYASRYSTGNATLFKINGVTDTIAVYDNYTNKAIFKNLVPNAQGQIIVFLKPGTNYTHLNGFMLTEQGADYKDSDVVVPDRGKQVLATTAVPPFIVFPNPVQNQLILQLDNEYRGQMKVRLITVAGVVAKEFELTKDQQEYNQKLPVSELAKGNYILIVQMGEWEGIKKIMKL